jgi:hypothetical protein
VDSGKGIWTYLLPGNALKESYCQELAPRLCGPAGEMALLDYAVGIGQG